jgi:putative FmdB family regulatory protein
MPIYEYECADCHYQFEALVPFAHRDEIACEKCASPAVTRLASTFAATGSGEGVGALVGGGGCCSGGCGCCGD